VIHHTARPSGAGGTIQQEIAQLTKRLEVLQDEARKVVTDLEMQLSEITGRPTATQIKVEKGFAPLTDDQLEVQILFVLQKEPEGLNAVSIAGRLNQAPQRIRQWIKKYPKVLNRVEAGTGTKFFLQ